ncbi:transporter substrate-binding domain-containing protein [Streptomyces sp. NBC_01794]|uniref:transporter substrate-binding domain-containing protein n=1 Tax=Streptomyces sp. NBC_01794 TaxID=2975942 RepID=UPI00308ED3AD|nr:transporter substrate-binding domain-containing protein [Streptomyces sp. NBC_01794]
MSRTPRPRPAGHEALRRPSAGFAAALAVVITAALTACGSPSDEPRFLGAERVTVATHNDLPGISYSENYDRSGVDYLLFKRVKEELGVRFSEPVDVSSGDRIAQLEGGTADMVIASFSITPERMRKIDFVGPYFKTRQGFLVGSDGWDITKIEDLRGKRVCTWDGTTSQEALGNLKGMGVVVQVLDDASDCIDALVDGQVAAVSTDQAILYGFAHQHAAESLRVLPGLTIGAPQLYGIGLPKGHREDCRKLAGWLKEFVGTSEWTGDIATSLPELPLADPGWVSTHKPSDASIDARSCRDKPSP